MTRIHTHRSYASLAAWRRAHGLSQEAAAKQFGVSQSCWAKVELGRRRPRRDLLQKLTSETGVPVETLVGVTL